jgi:amino acid permease
MLIAFLCQFNAVEIFSGLKEPTKERVDRVMRATITFSGSVFTIFGLAGYVLGFDACSDNILNNFSPRDPSLVVARSGLVFTLICQLPMIGVPCRNLTLLVYGHLKRLLQNRRSRSASILSREQMDTIAKSPSSPSLGTSLFDSPLFGGDGSAGSSPITRWFTRSSSTDNALSSAADTSLADQQRSLSTGAPTLTATSLHVAATAHRPAWQRRPSLSVAGKRALNRQRSLSMQGVDPEETSSQASRIICACMLVVTTLIMGELVPGVAVIWTIAGSSVSLLLAFILPSLAYIMLWRIANERDAEEAGLEAEGEGAQEAFQWRSPSFWREVWHSDRDLVYASLLFVFSALLAPVCTYWSIHNHK